MKTKEYQAPNCRVIFMPAIKPLMSSESSANIQDTSSGFTAGFSEDEEDLEGN